MPDAPEAWLLTAARRKSLDRHRRGAAARRLAPDLAFLEQTRRLTDPALPDDRLRLLYACAHPDIEPAVRAPLMLQCVLGLDAARMAGAFLVSPATLGQRLSRAKARIAARGTPLTLPDAGDIDDRLDDMLAAIYAAYSVGFDGAPAGDGKARGVGAEAVWLASLMAHLRPDAAEAAALLALMLFAEARRPARLDAEGRFVPLDEQDTALWDAALLADARTALANAAARASLGRYQLEAAIQSVHVARRETGATDRAALLHLYEGLVRVAPTLGAATGRAAALAEVEGAAAGLAALDALGPAARGYQPWWALRGDLGLRLGDTLTAREALDRAAALSADPAVRAWLLARKPALH